MTSNLNAPAESSSNAQLGTETRPYDLAFIGSGIIPALEAVYQHRCGKRTVMIDESQQAGGAWTPLELFGATDVENAIHYFLQDAKGFEFMREVLGWNVVRSERKYRILNHPILGLQRISYDNPFGKFLAGISSGAKPTVVLRDFAEGLMQTALGARPTSRYVTGGASEMLAKTRSLIEKAGVEIRLSSRIEEAKFEPERGLVRLEVSCEGGRRAQVFARRLGISHGSKIERLTTETEALTLELKRLRRPAAHYFVEDDAPAEVLEAIFSDRDIKYIHDVTRFTKEAAELSGKRKIFVSALHPDSVDDERLHDRVLAKMKAAGLVGRNASLLDRRWWEVYLPALDNDDLARIKSRFGDQALVMSTENFARGIGLCADRWRTKFAPPATGTSFSLQMPSQPPTGVSA